MKKRLMAFVLIFTILFSNFVLAGDGGEMGTFGGISEGSNLPKNIEKYVDSGLDPQTEFEYQEVVFLSGEPIELQGTITVEIAAIDIVENPMGTYSETYTINASNAAGDTMNKTIEFLVLYREISNDANLFGTKIKRDSYLVGWTENYTLGGNNYQLIENQSNFEKTSVEDITPGVSYYDTTISYEAEYANGTDRIYVSYDGNVYGYNQPWSKVETQDSMIFIENIGENNWQMQVHIKPYLHAKKTMYYDETKPYPISFSGTYNQRFEREATLSYEILTTSLDIPKEKTTGSISLDINNAVEKLPVPDGLEFIEGHWAEEDIKKLYSLEILTEKPHEGMQYEAMTRGAFVKALCLAMNINTTQYNEPTIDSPQYYGDVDYTHPNYAYVMAATDAKLVQGVGSDFDVDKPITRQEAFVIYIRVIGLEGLGVSNNPITPFVDDKSIATWAKKEIMAGYDLGIIKGDELGKVQPLRMISKSEAAAIINRLIDYLRDEISQDYQL